jgi:predicted MFS family arabinose efflux permease
MTARTSLAVMAAAAGIAVANVYLCQPLLAAIATDFALDPNQAGWVASAAQAGYATGILLIVPLADHAGARRLLRTLLAAACVALLGAAASPGIVVLVGAAFAVSLASVVPQVLVPLAVAAGASSGKSAGGGAGRIVATMQTGIILGILLSRTVSGSVAQWSGTWRASFLLAAVLNAVLLFVLPRFLPAQAPPVGPRMAYPQLIASLPGLLVRWPGLRLSAALGATVFGAFSAFWATLAFHLAQPPFGFGPAQAGLFGLWGLAGALLAPQAGKLADRYGAGAINVLGIVAAALGFALFVTAGQVSVLALVVGVNFLDFGNQAGQIANQARIFKLDPAARARLNTVYMVLTFAGGAAGTLLGVAAWRSAGWTGVGITGLVLLAAAFAIAAASMWRKS